MGPSRCTRIESLSVELGGFTTRPRAHRPLPPRRSDDTFPIHEHIYCILVGEGALVAPLVQRVDDWLLVLQDGLILINQWAKPGAASTCAVRAVLGVCSPTIEPLDCCC